MKKLSTIIRTIFHGVPMLIVIMIGGALGLLVDLTEWRWAERVELALRGVADRMERTFTADE